MLALVKWVPDPFAVDPLCVDENQLRAGVDGLGLVDPSFELPHPTVAQFRRSAPKRISAAVWNEMNACLPAMIGS